jgi:amino acid adenylation domain-containing protein
MSTPAISVVRSISEDESEAANEQVSFDPLVCIAKLVSLQALSTPEAIAVVDNGGVLTYAELDARASELAQQLCTLGVGPNILVGLCLARSTAMVVGALGILKAGGAYLPLDPAYPVARLAFQLNDAGVPVLVTGQCVTEQLPVGTWRVVALDSKGRQTKSSITLRDGKCPAVEVHGQDLAYVIYTSGSTGQPKGVEITHAGVQNLIAWHQQTFAVTPNDRATLQATPGFDAAVWELWPYLTSGASIHIPDDNTRNDPEHFRDWLVAHAITISFVPTPMAEQLMELEWPSNTALRFLLIGADTLRHYPPATLPFALVNNYGPTECTVVTTSGTVAPNGTPDRPPSIGRPISNVQVYILDENRQQLPPGRPGELYIGGAGLARGYRNRPDLTAERFVPHPFGKEPGSRLYRTGDMVCSLPDGEIAFLGRIDDQVKIRGYRVELDEVVTALNHHPMVQASVVVAREDVLGNKCLVAYVVPKQKVRLTAKILREFLLLSLPHYMVPAIFCRLDSLPLTASGKIDRNAVPPPTQADQLNDDEYIAPRTAVEKRMTGMLASLLRLDRVGMNDNFFLLGGHSLLAAQVIARVRDTFDVDLSLLSLFDHPTVAELSAEIEQLLISELEAMSEDEAVQLLTTPGDVSF